MKPNSSCHDAEPKVWQSLYLMLLCLIGTCFLWALADGVEVRTPMNLIFLGLLILTLKRWTAALMLGIVQAYLYVQDVPSLHSDPVTLSVEFFRILLITLMVLCVSRFRALNDGDDPSILAPLKATLQGMVSRERAVVVSMRSNVQTFVGWMLRTVLLISLCAVVAETVLTMFPVDPRSGTTIREFRLKPNGYRALMMSVTLFGLVLPLILLAGELVWRTMSAAQARTYQRSIFLGLLHTDLRMILFRRQKLRRSRQRPQERPADPTPPNTLLMSESQE
ncbi:MAG: hypothetical protein R3C49_07685 [Planctomycetaceae bacterium]